MRTSFYFVLWQLAWLPAILLDIPFLNEYGFFFAFIIVFFVDCIIKKLLKDQIAYQQMCEVAFVLEMAYNNDYKKYKRQVLLQMIVYIAIFVYILLFFIALFTEFSNVPLIDYILWGIFVILASISSSWYIRLYLQVRKAGGVMLNKELQEIYLSYKDERDTHTSEEMLLPRPKFYQVINTANTLFAILCIVIGLLTTIIFYMYNPEFSSEMEFYQLGSSIYGILAIYCGVKDLLRISSSQKYILLLLSCAITALLYVPITHYMNEDSLAAYIANDPNLSYDAKDNLVQETIILDEIGDIEPAYLKQRLMLLLSTADSKKLLKKTIRVGAEYQLVFRDKSGNEQIIIISPSELREIYHQTKSNLESLLEILKLDFNGAKVYEDGEYIVVEIRKWENVPYPMQSEQDFSKWLVNYSKICAKDYDIASFNRGLTMRFIFDDDRFIEHTLSLEELKREEAQIDLEEPEQDSTSLFNIFSNTPNNNE